jgi:hypothetical protein
MSLSQKMSFCTFVKGRPYFEKFSLGGFSRGFFMVQVLQDFIVESSSVALVVEDLDLLSCSLDRFVFRPVAFLVNLLKMGFDPQDLVSRSNYYTVFDESCLCSTNLYYTIFLCLKKLFEGLVCEVAAIRAIDALMGQNNGRVYYKGTQLVNCASNIGIFYPYLIGQEIGEKDRVYDEDIFFLVEEEENLRRSRQLIMSLKYERVGSVVRTCPHVEEKKIEEQRPVVTSFNDLKEDEREVYVVNENKTDQIIEEEQRFKNGTKNALSILHFIDFYRKKWNEVDNVYVIGVASNPHLVSVADFFHDKQVIYIDPMPCYKGYFGMRTNVEYLWKAIDDKFEFRPNSAVISDVRSEIDDESVHRDNLLQFSWSRHENVKFGTYKFRYPYVQKVEYEQKIDFLFVQCFKGSRSSESRAYISPGAVLSLPDSISYDEQYCFFNNKVRFKGESCNDCRLREVILEKYKMLPRVWALMFNFLDDGEMRKRYDLNPCAHVERDKKYLSECEYCNWLSVLILPKESPNDDKDKG